MSPAAKIDRVQPTRRPARKVRGYQQWRSLLFLHWAVPREKLRSLVPDSLELDLYRGQAYVGVVPFAMRGVRPAWCPACCAFNFLETNVRTYVVGGSQPGVYFFSLEAASALAVWVARTFWGLPYYHATMRMQREGDEVVYESARRGPGTRHRVRYRIAEALGRSEPDSLEFFLLERYLLFTQRRDRLYVGQVHHAPYPAQRAELLEVEDELLPAAGFETPQGPPAFVHYAAGVDVEIFGLQPVR